MGLCVFKTDDMRRCVAHALTNRTCSVDETGQPKPPGLFFVHDSGVYLMSNGSPGDKLEPENPDSRMYVAYADGCNPNIGNFDSWYGRSRDLVGGDDFVEFIDITPAWLTACDEFEEFHVDVGATTFMHEFAKPKAAK